MKLLEYIPNLDCRRYKKDWGSATKNERDWNDYLDQHQIEYKYQNIIRNSYLSHYFPVRAYDLAHALNRDYLLSFDVVNSIIKELVNNNKFIHVDKRESDGDITQILPIFISKIANKHSGSAFIVADKILRGHGENERRTGSRLINDYHSYIFFLLSTSF